MTDLTGGTRVGGNSIGRLADRGGFGAGCVAEDRRLGRRMALEVMDLALTEDDRARRRVVEESREGGLAGPLQRS